MEAKESVEGVEKEDVRVSEKNLEAPGLPSSSAIGVSHSLRSRLQWVVFPNNPWIQLWDAVILFSLWMLAFILPFQIGVSGGYYLIVSPTWLAFNILLNTVFFVDTFLYFFRAYYNPRTGLLVCNSKKISRGYAKGLFLPNLISCFPSTILFYLSVKYSAIGSRDTVMFLKVVDLLKFIRFARVSRILNSSDLITKIRHKMPSQALALTWFLFLLVLVSHWFACIWCLVAFIEAKSFAMPDLLYSSNWISFWYNNTQTELYPFGYENSPDRYVLSLFWSIQTLTSIGYGNIAPYTVTEWWVACFLMLLAGLMWAYVIGSTVSIAASLQQEKEMYSQRIDKVNRMARMFSKPEEICKESMLSSEQTKSWKHGFNCLDKTESSHTNMKASGFQSSTESMSESMKEIEREAELPMHPDYLAKKIRSFLHTKYLRGHGNPERAVTASFAETFDIMDALPQELKEQAALLLCKDALNRIPYFTGNLLPLRVQKYIASNVALLDFSAGERFSLERYTPSDYRGIFYFRLGVGFMRHFYTMPSGAVIPSQVAAITNGQCLGYNHVIIEEGNPLPPERIEVGFLTYSEVFFIPREVVWKAMEMYPPIWNTSAKYRYVISLLAARAFRQANAHR